MRQYPIGPPASMLAGTDVALVGLFSAKDREFGAKLDALAASVEAHGGRVVREGPNRQATAVTNEPAWTSSTARARREGYATKRERRRRPIT
ncbi:hypothetical protein ABZV78_08380 [Micromonospora sp. NPDC004540]|uniref:hypothetical protein n=1 Tax=Micromonospora sp. NPDC004540 TaxID=3154457 RepID=UPI0033AC3951